MFTMWSSTHTHKNKDKSQSKFSLPKSVAALSLKRPYPLHFLTSCTLQEQFCVTVCLHPQKRTASTSAHPRALCITWEPSACLQPAQEAARLPTTLVISSLFSHTNFSLKRTGQWLPLHNVRCTVA